MIDTNYYQRVEGIARSARAITGNPKVTVELQEPNSVPATDGRRIFLRTPLPTFTEEEWTQWYGESFHEIGHLQEGSKADFDVLRKRKINFKSVTGLVFNFISDHCQERYRFEEWAGRKKYLSELCRIFWENKGLKRYGTNRTEQLKPEDRLVMDKLEALVAWEVTHRKSWMPGAAFVPAKMIPLMTPTSRKYYDRLMAGTYGDELANECCTEQHGVQAAVARADLTARIMREIFNDTPEQDESGSGAEGQKDGEEGHEGSEASGEKGEGDEMGNSNSDVKSPSDSEPVSGDVPYEDILAHTHKGPQAGDGKSGRYTHVDYSNYSKDSHTPWDLSDIAVVDFANGQILNPSRVARLVMDDEHGTRGHDFNLNDGVTLCRQLERLFQCRNRSRYVYGQKKGLIHQKNIVRIAYNTPGYSERIFKRKVSTQVTDTAVLVGLDCSGSMTGTKFSHAGSALVLLSRLLNLIQVPHELAGYTFVGAPMHYVFKPFGKKLPESKLQYFLGKATRAMNTNADGEFLLWANKRLTERREKRKILIMLSDGSPTGGKRPGDPKGFAKDVAGALEARKDTELYAIGIMDANVTRIYRESTVIRKASELEDALLTVIKTKLLNSN